VCGITQYWCFFEKGETEGSKVYVGSEAVVN